MAKQIGFGAGIKKGGLGTNGTYLAQVISISREASEANKVDTTTLDGTDRFRTKIAGLIEPGSIKLKIVYDPTDSTLKTWMAEHEAGGTTTYAIIYPTTTVTQSFSGFVASVGAEVPLDDVITCDIGLQITGDPGWTT